jgi:hypothetical protein
MANRVSVAPQMLRWARGRSGRSTEELEQRFPKLSEWEAGEGQPTSRQLEDYAQATYTPVGFLFLVEPPEEQLPIAYFRNVRTLTPGLQDTIHACKQRQDRHREFAEANGSGRVALVGSLSLDVDVNDAAAQLRGTLGFDRARRVEFSPWTAALSGLREHAEEAGILVMISGMVGTNTHRKRSPDGLRGLALVDELAPLVLINGADTKAEQIFTLVHELAHIALGEPTVSWPDLGEIERWCDLVAVKLLAPAPGRSSHRHSLTPSERSLRAQPAANTSWARTADRTARMRRYINLPSVWDPVGVEMDYLLNAMDRTAANLAKLDHVWARAACFMPTGPVRGSNPQYDDLRRAWADLLPGLPSIDGWTITDPLPDIDKIGQIFETSQHPVEAYEMAQQPGKDLAEYRYRLNRAHRRAARERLQQLTAVIDTGLPRLLRGVPRDSQERLENPDVDQLTAAVGEIERLMGNIVQRRGRWGDLHRHLYFGQGHDWHDIHELDWPSVRSDVEAAAFYDPDPLPVPDIDLGKAAGGHLTGTATIALPWDRLDDEGFERLLYDLLRDIPEYHNVQLLMQTRAADRGRDLSLDRVLRDSTGSVRNERVIVQAKHWLTRSVGPTEVANTVAIIKLWPPPVVRGLVIATSGYFSADAVAWTEKHNNDGAAPFIELWPKSKLESLLAQKPHLAAAHGLR